MGPSRTLPNDLVAVYEDEDGLDVHSRLSFAQEVRRERLALAHQVRHHRLYFQLRVLYESMQNMFLVWLQHGIEPQNIAVRCVCGLTAASA